MLKTTISVCIFLAIFIMGTCGMRRVCYYTNWSQYRPGRGKFVPENIDPYLCTHIVYAFAKMNSRHGLQAFEWNDDNSEWATGMYEKVNNLKRKNKSLKTLIAVGGWNMGSEPFKQMVGSPANISMFVTYAIQFMRKRNFDGLDLDWEYPGNRGSPPKDKFRYTHLVRELKRAFDAESLQTNRPRLLLTSAVAAGKDKIDSAYEMKKIGKYMDFISVMTYDLHGSWEKVTGHNSPLHRGSWETDPPDAYLNLEWSMLYWAKNVPRFKLNAGLALYGRSFTLNDVTKKNVNSDASKAGTAGKFTRESGFLSYYEICDLINQNKTYVYRINDQKVPFLVNNNQWVGYDDVKSLREKVAFIKKQKFGGIMVWALDLDDFNGQSCGKGNYTLLKSINDDLGVQYKVHKEIVPELTVEQSAIGTHEPAPSINIIPIPEVPIAKSVHRPSKRPKSIDGFTCPESAGMYPSHRDCKEYFQCAEGTPYSFKCQNDLEFNAKLSICDWKKNAKCKITSKKTQVNALIPDTPQPVNHAKQVPVEHPSFGRSAVPDLQADWGQQSRRHNERSPPVPHGLQPLPNIQEINHQLNPDIHHPQVEASATWNESPSPSWDISNGRSVSEQTTSPTSNSRVNENPAEQLLGSNIFGEPSHTVTSGSGAITPLDLAHLFVGAPILNSIQDSQRVTVQICTETQCDTRELRRP